MDIQAGWGFILVVLLTWQTTESYLLSTSCGSNTCSGNGACSIVNGVVKCHCHLNYAGDHCELTDFCLDYPCGNHGHCKTISHYPHFMCICDAGCTGQFCSTQVTGSQSSSHGQPNTTCDGQYCNHHGDCSEVNGHQTCICHSGYSGNRCQYTNFCLGLPCGSHGHCKDINHYPHFMCTCNAGYTGQYCSTQVTGSQSSSHGQPYTTCDSQYCNHHGDCSEVNGHQTCHCHSGYSGHQCQHTTCSTSQCSLKGSCIGDTSNIQCQCYHGYYGSRCQQVDVQIAQGTCGSSCSGHGVCYNVQGFDVCSCHHNYYGETCQLISSNHSSTDCHSEDCSHEGTCHMQNGRPHCQCYPNRYGDYCEYFVVSTTAAPTTTASAATSTAAAPTTTSNNGGTQGCADLDVLACQRDTSLCQDHTYAKFACPKTCNMCCSTPNDIVL
ncbi:sushi, nidogen and EGF-like domain-containing protein 1 [Mya arenaria]|uniref:sushi, nidogen and EGF-like domain-containing protein 1 n=1 Tax=Mya arenaria TaxID=6604 RepID=UPI0022DEB88F|nr:sushi, nidogen and EGF-like domain-containing protein 1 [Mya arenaria]